MGTTLQNGVYLPNEGERNCYAGLKTNWEILDQKVADVTALQQAVAGALHREIVESLPTTDIDPNTIYMILSGTSATEKVYNEYMYVNNAWELIGTSATDLTNYYTKAEVDGKLLLKASASDLTSHTGDTTIHVTTADKNKWNNGVSQSYVLRYSSTTITDNSTIAYSTLDNTDNIKVSDKIIDTDGKIFSVVSVDSDNSTVTVGNALIDLALDANVMHLSGDETVAGIKNFTDDTYFKSLNFTNKVASTSSSGGATLPILSTVTYTDQTPSAMARVNLSITAGGFKSLYPHENNVYSLGLTNRLWSDFYSYHGYFRGQQQNDEYSNNARTNLTLLANRDTLGQSGCLVDTFRENTAQGTGSHTIGFGIKENSIRYEGCRFSWLWNNDLNGYVFSLIPNLQGANPAVAHNLGSSTDKWATINGLNPSSLGMPDLSNGIDISSYFDINLYTGQTYTPIANGWISISITSPNRGSLLCESVGISQTAYGVTDPDDNNKYRVSILVPCQKNQVLTTYIRASGGTINNAKFYPCQGNV